ncbi:MAG TPA: HAD-IIB family hydrolase [Chloroflexota bacterium]|nr:HAD-IIB family hydrolase [Chloroflexota bacterium]
MVLAFEPKRMRYVALACDYDGTLAQDGVVSERTAAALRALRDSGRRLILVSGRELEDLLSVFDGIELFDAAVLENGGLLYRPADRSTQVLTEPPSERLVELLRKRGVEPLSIGRAIIATWEPHQTAVLEAIHELGLEMQVIFNKGAVMVLPSGVNKGTGLARALDELGLSAHNVVGIGDAENDHAFLAACECAAAVANALPTVKERADIVTEGARGDGVAELIGQLLDDDLASVAPRLGRHEIVIGTRAQAQAVCMAPYGERVLVAGPSGSGKSKTVTALVERLGAAGYQFCLVDPEGDYEGFENSVRLGDASHAPTMDEIMAVLNQPRQTAIVNLLGLALEDRPAFFANLVPRLSEMRSQTARPHWLVVDEAHHMLPIERDPSALGLPRDFQGLMLVTVHIDRLAPSVLEPLTTAIAVGDDPGGTLAAVAKAVGERAPAKTPAHLGKGQVAVWRRKWEKPVKVELEPATADHRRHVRKYATGELADDECFYFRGPKGKLNLKAQNLVLFAQLAQGVDDATWEYHLRQHDYSQWFERAIKDRKLASAAARVERNKKLSPRASRERIVQTIQERYTLPA